MTEHMTAESDPVVRLWAKRIGLVATGALFVAALFVTVSAMLARSEGGAWPERVGLVVLGVASDLLVLALPVIVLSSFQSRLGVWRWIGSAALASALVLTLYNKIYFWELVLVEDARRAAVAQVDTLAPERALVAQYPDAPPAAVVEGALAGAEAARDAKRAEIVGIPDTRISALQIARQQLADIELTVGQLRSELGLSQRVEAARAALATGEVKRAAAVVADPKQSRLVALISAIAHEAFQLACLGLGTLRIPPEQAEREQAYMLHRRKLRMKKRIEKLAVRLEEVKEIATRRKIYRALKARLPAIAAQRATLEADREEWDVQQMRRNWESEREYQQRGGQQPIDESHQITDAKGEPASQSAKARDYPRGWSPETTVIDEQSGAPLHWVKAHLRKKPPRNRRRVGGRTHAEVEIAPPPPVDDPAIASPSDNRQARTEPTPEPEPTSEAGETHIPPELMQKLIEAGAIDGEGNPLRPLTGEEQAEVEASAVRMAAE